MQEVNIVDLFKRLLVTKFSGVILLHLQNGQPKLAEFTKERVNLREIATTLSADLDKLEGRSAQSSGT